MAKKLKWGFHERDIAFLKDVGVMDTKLVAQKHKMRSTNSVSNCLNRIQLRLARCQNYVNAIRALQKENERIRKKTSSGSIPLKYQTESFIAETKQQERTENEE